MAVELELDPGGVDLGDGGVEVLRIGGGRGEAVLRLEAAGGGYRVRLLARERGGMRDAGSTPIRARGSTRLRVEWSAATGPALAHGRATLVKKGRARLAVGDLDNPGRTVGRLRLGLPGGSRGAVGGAFLVDRVVVSR